MNKFRLVIDGMFSFHLTKKNYSRIIGNPQVVRVVTDLINELEQSKDRGMLISKNGHSYQVNKE